MIDELDRTNQQTKYYRKFTLVLVYGKCIVQIGVYRLWNIMNPIQTSFVSIWLQMSFSCESHSLGYKYRENDRNVSVILVHIYGNYSIMGGAESEIETIGTCHRQIALIWDLIWPRKSLYSIRNSLYDEVDVNLLKLIDRYKQFKQLSN